MRRSLPSSGKTFRLGIGATPSVQVSWLRSSFRVGLYSLNDSRLPDIGFESYDSMEGLIAIDRTGPPTRFGSWPGAKLIRVVYPGLLVDNIVDRNTYAYRGFYVDATRAVDFLLSRPEVDHTRIGVHGSSQGGALTLTTAALRADAIACGAAGPEIRAGTAGAILASSNHSHRPWPAAAEAPPVGTRQDIQLGCPGEDGC